jgi:hypothetical protein
VKIARAARRESATGICAAIAGVYPHSQWKTVPEKAPTISETDGLLAVDVADNYTRYL